jgi:hypothetical protein
MKGILILFLLLLSAFSYGHDTYFAFAEMEYDEDCSCLEISIKVSAHDLNSIAENQTKNYLGLEKTLNSKEGNSNIIQQIILQGFEINQYQKKIVSFYEGFELNNDGDCFFYFKTEKLEKGLIDIRFDLFMNTYLEQQNKLIYNKSDHSKQTFVFFGSSRETKITL